jgi:hypothetical protein
MLQMSKYLLNRKQMQRRATSQTMCMHTSMSNESSQYRGRLKPVDCLKKGHDKLNVI